MAALSWTTHPNSSCIFSCASCDVPARLDRLSSPTEPRPSLTGVCWSAISRRVQVQAAVVGGRCSPTRSVYNVHSDRCACISVCSCSACLFRSSSSCRSRRVIRVLLVAQSRLTEVSGAQWTLGYSIATVACGRTTLNSVRTPMASLCGSRRKQRNSDGAI